MSELITLVPVLDRPKNVDPLIDSFERSATPGRLVFVATEGDDRERKALDNASAEYVLTQAVSWPRKINEAYLRFRDECDWVLFGADDIDFHEGWWDETKPFRDIPELSVIGTNDLGNPRVIAGDHTTHALVRSSYLGTVDDPHAIVHTGYRHWCVDDEFLWTAKLRGVWAFCPTAIIEHLHPYWKKGKWDSTYAQGELNAKKDMRLWAQRAPLLGLSVADSEKSTGYKT